MPGRRQQPSSPERIPKELRTGWLLLLLRKRPSYGYMLRRDLHNRGFPVEPSMLYRTLRELEGDELIVSSWQEPSGGPRARVYTIPPNGESALRELAATIDRLRGAQAAFLKAYEQAGVRRPPPAPSPPAGQLTCDD